MNALRTVEDPDLHKDLVSLDMIRDLTISSEGRVSLRVVLTTPACPMKEKIESDVRAAVNAVPGVTGVDIKMDAEVRKRAVASPNAIPGVTHIIAVSSGKGGVGKSTVSVNLAVSLALDGARVGIMDADIYGPNLPTMLGVTEMPKIEQRPTGEMFIPPTAHGLKVMSMGFLVQPDQPMVWRGPMLHSVMTQFCRQVDWGELDYLVVDMPPGTGDIQLSLAQLVPVTGTVMVSTPQEVALQDVRKAFYMWEKVRIPVLGVVENMSFFRADDGKEYPIFGKGGGELLARKFGTEVLAHIPIVPLVCQGGDEGRPIVVRDPESEAAQVFRSLARRVAQNVSIQASKATAPIEIQL